MAAAESTAAAESVRRLQGPGRPAPFAVAFAADRELTNELQWVPCSLQPGQEYRLTAIVEGEEFTEDIGALVAFDMADPQAGGDGLRTSAKGTLPPYLYLRTGPHLHRTDRTFTVASPVHRIGFRAWHDRGPVTLRTLVIELAPTNPVDFFFSFDVDASNPYRPATGSAIDEFVWGKGADGEFGIRRICDVLEQHGIVGNFMVDFASCAAEGEARLAEIIDHLAGRGHEVHLRLHPQDLPYPTPRSIERDRLAKLSQSLLDVVPYDMARLMLDYTIAVYERFVQRRPRVFRSGGYRFSKDLVRAAGELGIEAFSNVRRDAVRDRSLRGGDPALSHEPFVWDNGLIEIPVDVGSPETITAEKYEHVYSRIIKQKRYERTFNLVMHSWSLLSRTDEADGSGGTGPDPETRLHEMCEHATKHGRASGYGDYLDRTQGGRRTVRTDAIQRRS